MRSTRPVTALKTAILLAVTLLALPTTSAASAPPTPADQEKRVLSVRRLATLTKQDVANELRESGFDTSAVSYGVETYQLVYRTTDEFHRPTVASGLLVLPDNTARRWHTVSFAHGTQSYRLDAPSMRRDDFAEAPALAYGAAGFGTVAPDYLGMGISPGAHPWMDVPSETTASLDMLRAAREYVSRSGRSLDSDVLVTGFSQGASAAMGLARGLESGADPNFRLGALAPVSGAYAMRDVELPAMLDGDLEPKSSALYSAYLLVAYDRLHDVYDSPDEVFQAPYDRTVEQLFDGSTPGRDLFRNTPDRFDQLLTPRAVEMLRNPTGGLADALRTADSVCTDWTPRAPVRLYVAPEDEQAATANTTRCRATLAARGVDAPVVSVGPADYEGSRHLGSNVAATAEIVRWFADLTS